MAISSGAKFRCYPTRVQKQILSQWMGCQRVIYNAKVDEYRHFRTFSRKAVALTCVPVPVDQQYSQFKNRELSPYLYDEPPTTTVLTV